MKIEVLIDDDIGDQALAATLRRLADRLDPPPPVSVTPPPRSRPKVPGIRFDTSTSGSVLTCARCSWRAGPYPTDTSAIPDARSHFNLCARAENEFRRTRSVPSPA